MKNEIDIMDLAQKLIDNLNRLEAKSMEESIYYRGAKAGVVEFIKLIKQTAGGEGNSGQSGQQQAVEPELERSVNGPLPETSPERRKRLRAEAKSDGKTPAIPS